MVKANLSRVDLHEARYNSEPYKDEAGSIHQPTQWPDNFDPSATGAIDISKEDGKEISKKQSQ